MTKWTDTTTFANLPAPDTNDLLPIADVSLAVGSRQKTITVGQLALALAGESSIEDLTDVNITDLGYAAGAGGTTTAADMLIYSGTEWVAGRERRSIWYRPATTLTLTASDHRAFIYSDGIGVEFPDSIPTGFEFTVFTGNGSGTATVSRTGSTSLAFVSNSSTGSGLNTVTLPETTFATFRRVNGNTIAVEIIEPDSAAGDVSGPGTSTSGNIATFNGTTGKLIQDSGTTVEKLRLQSFIIACSDETTALTTGTAKATFRMPYAFTLTAVRASVTTAPTGSALTVDINEGPTSILSTKLTIDAAAKTSVGATTAAVISDTALADDAEITIDIDQIGSTVAGAGLKVTLIGYAT